MILVVGATGQLGGMITLKLLEQRRDVRILLRRNSPSEQLAAIGLATPHRILLEAGATPVYGDLKDYTTLRDACRGVSTVVTTANSALRVGEDSVQTVDLDGNLALVHAARAEGVKHFVFTSALGAESDSPVPFMQAKAKVEGFLRSGEMTHTILKPNVFMEVWVGMVVAGPIMRGQPVTIVGEGRRKHSFVSMRDVSAYAVSAMDSQAARNRTIVIGGPEAVSWRDVIATFGQALGKPIEVQTVAPGEPVPGLPEAVLPLMAGFETYDSPIDMAETSRTFGITPTPLSEVVRGMIVA